jgi:D-glycerate 3-kinase
VALGLDVIGALARGRATALPRFDKASDDRCPRAQWPIAGPGVDVLLFEGWCVGAHPEPEGALAAPINALERDEDRETVWRRYVNAALAGDYAALFAQVDRLVMLRAPSFAAVTAWRLEQETKLRETAGMRVSRVMSEPEVRRFVQFFERTTRHCDQEMPARADLLVELDERRQVRAWRDQFAAAVMPRQSLPQEGES